MPRSTIPRESAPRLPHRCSTLGGSSSPQLRFPFLEGPRPVGLEQSRERAIGEDASTGLTSGAVIRLVGRVANALHGRATDGAGLLVLAVHRHLLAKRRDLLGEVAAGLVTQPRDPFAQRALRGLVQARDFFV